ncbi:hypothetical protein KJ866_04655 [Patescibacteria group bacterium]|nr:hypothetical protein [Patescibacteria group bacterium]MBU2219922.1 hypothetical protein [Patescibacteria group bacterium]
MINLDASIINNNHLQRNLAGVIFFVMLANLIIGGILIPYQQAQAQWAVVAPLTNVQLILKNVWDGIYQAYDKAKTAIIAAVKLWEKQQAILKKVLKAAWDYLRLQLLHMLVNDIVAWIQGGGEPRFVTDWQSFLRTAADKAGGNFVTQYLGAGFLCEAFDLKLQIALAKPQTFDESVTCSLSDITDNIDDFFSDFSNGGWEAWLAVSEPNNNIFGADLLALDKKYDVMAAAQEAAKNDAASAAGYLGDKVCVKRQCNNQTTGQPGQVETYSGASLGWTKDQLDQGDGTSCTCFEWTTRTPGRVVGDSLQQALGIDIENLIQAKEFSEFAGAIIDAVINRAIREGIALMKSSPDGTSAGQTGAGISTPATVSANISSYADALTGSASAQTIIGQQDLYKENLKKLLAESQVSLGVLNNIKNSKNNVLSLYQQLQQRGCSNPPNIASSISATQNEISALNTKIASLNSDIIAIQTKISQVTTANIDTLAYKAAADAYIRVYEANISNPKAQVVLDAEAIFKAAQAKAIASNQALLATSSTDFDDFASQTTAKTSATAQEAVDVMTARGVISTCAYTQSNTLYKDLCDSQSKEIELQGYLSAC